jgi:predicted aconitase with swiveling domain
LEAVRLGTAPAAIVLAEPDAILALGAAVARELYGVAPPVIVLDAESYQGVGNDSHVLIDGDAVAMARSTEK